MITKEYHEKLNAIIKALQELNSAAAPVVTNAIEYTQIVCKFKLGGTNSVDERYQNLALQVGGEILHMTSEVTMIFRIPSSKISDFKQRFVSLIKFISPASNTEFEYPEVIN